MKKVKCYKRKSILTFILIVPSYKETPNLAAIFKLKYSKTFFSGLHKDPDFICNITWAPLPFQHYLFWFLTPYFTFYNVFPLID